MTFKDYKEKIRCTKKQGGIYWHNIVGCTLSMAAAELGKATANRLIRECGLLRLGWKEEV